MPRLSESVRILLLEDDTNLRQILTEVLEHAGYDVVAAGDGGEAMEKAMDHDFEVLIFDVKLPGPDGLDTLARFKSTDPDILSVIITGYATEQDTLRALRLGVGDYLKKPFPMDEFTRSIGRVAELALKRRKARREQLSTLGLTLWSLESQASALDRVEPCSGYGRFESVQILDDYFRHLGYSDELKMEMKIALYYLLLRNERASEGAVALPERLLQLCQDMEEVQNPDTGLASLGHLGLRLVDDPKVLDTLRSLHGEPASDVGSEKQGQHLLRLGYSFLASGDPSAAEDAFTSVAVLSNPKRSGSARLELAKLAAKRGQVEEARSWLKALVSNLTAVAPQARAHLEVEAGLLALQLGFQDGAELLKRGGARIRNLGSRSDFFQVLVAQRAADAGSVPDDQFKKALQALLSTANLHRLIGMADWILPPLLGQWHTSQGEDVQKFIERLLAESPKATLGLLSEEVSDEQLQVFLRFLVDIRRPLHPTRLERIATGSRETETKALAQELLALEYRESVPVIRVFSLGICEVWLGDQVVSQSLWKTAKARFLLAHLVLRRDRPIPQDTLIEEFWPGSAPGKGRRSLTQSVSELRRVLQSAGLPEHIEVVQRKHNVISLGEQVKIWDDLQVFRDFLAQGKQAMDGGDLRAALPHLREASLLVRGAYLEDCRLDWTEEIRRTVEPEVCQCLELLAHCSKGLGFYAEALEVSRDLLLLTPYHQAVHQLILELHLLGQRPDLAIAHFNRVKRQLKTELEIEPNTELLKLHQEAKLSV